MRAFLDALGFCFVIWMLLQVMDALDRRIDVLEGHEWTDCYEGTAIYTCPTQKGLAR